MRYNFRATFGAPTTSGLAMPVQRWPEAKDLYYPQIDSKVRRSSAESIGNYLLIRADGVRIEAVVLVRDERGGTTARGTGKCGPCVELVIGGQVTADPDIVRNAGVVDNEWRERYPVGRLDVSGQNEAMSYIERSASVVECRIVRIGQKVIDTCRVAFRVIVSIKTDHSCAMESRVDRCNQLTLPINSTRLKLVDVTGWRGERHVWICVRGAGKIWRANIVGQILVDPPAIQIGKVCGDLFRYPPIDSDGSLHIEGRMKLRRDRIVSRSGT